MKILTYKDYFAKEESDFQESERKLDDTVLQIIRHVRETGDEAVIHFTHQFDNIIIKDLIVSDKEFEEAEKSVTTSFKEAIQRAHDNIKEFHQQQIESSWRYERESGVTLGQQISPIDRVGVYVPGGKAAYPSTVLMDIIPAKIAGVEEIYMTTPPQEDGKINPHVLLAAKLAGVTKVYKIGGAQAIAALAYGTKTIQKVDKIVGPGNAYVARAKKWVFGDVAIDMIAGPSEICVLADDKAPSHFIAADLLSQAEHDEDAVPICITFSEAKAEAIKEKVDQQLTELPRQHIAEASLKQNGVIYVVEDLDEAFTLINDIAPEHLQLMIENASNLVNRVKHAGAIFIGNYSPEALGDYLAGPNHTLPTSGTARFSSPLGVYDFMKRSSIIHYSEAALLSEANYIEEIAQTEGLLGHAKAISIRKNKKE